MIAPLFLASFPAPETSVSYAHTAGEVAAYEVRGVLPVNDGRSKGDLKGMVLMTTVAVGPDGSAEMSFQDKSIVIKARGQTFELPETPPMVAKMDRQGYLLGQPGGNSLTGLAVLMFGIPGEPMTTGREFDWKPGGAFPASPDHAAKAKLRGLKGDKATIERSITTKEGQQIRIVTTHEVGSGRLTKGEITGKGQGGANVKITLMLKDVKREDGGR